MSIKNDFDSVTNKRDNLTRGGIFLFLILDAALTVGARSTQYAFHCWNGQGSMSHMVSNIEHVDSTLMHHHKRFGNKD